MVKLRFEVQTPLSPQQVTAAATDFSERRPLIWSGIDPERFTVHAPGRHHRRGHRGRPPVNRELERALAADALVAYTQDWHPAQTPHSSRAGACGPSTGSRELGCPAAPGPAGRRRGHPQGAGGEDGYSGFTVRDPVTGEEAATPLEQLLRRRGVPGGGGRAGDRLLRQGDRAGRGAAGVRHRRPGRAGPGVKRPAWVDLASGGGKLSAGG